MLAKSKLNSIKVLISKGLISSNIRHDEFMLIDNVLKGQCYRIVWSVKAQELKRLKNGRIMLLSKCAVYDRKKSRFIKKQEASGLSSSLGVRTSWSKITLLGPYF